MEIYQVLVRNLDGRTLCIRFSSPAIWGLDLKQKVCRLTGIRAECIRLATGTYDIYDDTELYAEDFLFRPVCLTSRLCGGKGGFGSLLRGAATKAGQKKTNNFDACRDMSGRRLRHVNAEKKLEEWLAGAEERKLEKLAENFLKKKSKEIRNAKSVDTDKYIEKYKEDSARCVEDVEASVKNAFKLYENSKRKDLSASRPASKRLKIWMGKGKEVDSDSDDEEADNENSVALQKSEPSSLKKDEGCSASVPINILNGESLGGSIQNGLEEVTGNSEQRGLHSSGECDNIAHDIDVPTLTESKLENFSSKVVYNDMDQCPDVKYKSNDNLAETFNGKIDQSPEVNFPAQSSQSLVGNESLADEKKDAELLWDGRVHSTHSETNVSDVNSPLDFNHYSTAADMEVLGAERLKVELQARGLKCGGTLQERAARLFLLKTTPLDKLPKKLLAKPGPPLGVIKKGAALSGKTHDIAVNS